MTLLYYTPTWEGFLTAVFEVFDRKRKNEQTSIRHPRERDAISIFPSESVEPDPVKAGRVERGMAKIAPDMPETVYRAWLSEMPEVEDALTALLALGFDQKRDPRGDLTDPTVRKVNKALNLTGGEAQRMLQFVRFVSVEDGYGASPARLYIADIEPLANVLSLIADHFHGRFNDQRFLIRDIKRRLILVSQREGWFIRLLSPGEALPPLPEDGFFEDLWRGYFHAVSNPARRNLKLQQHFVPLRYRKYLTEFQELPNKNNP